MIKKNIYKLLIAFFVSVIIIIFCFSIIPDRQTNLDLSQSCTYRNNINHIFGIKKTHAENPIPKNLKEGGDEPWVISLWNFCLSLVNIFLIGVLIYLGVVNILHLNYDTYQIKKFIVPLIVFVILANFSLFICRAIADFSSALSGSFLGNISDLEEGIKKGLGLSNNFDDIQLWIATLGGSKAAAGTAVGVITMAIRTVIGVVVSLIASLIIFVISFILYVRVYIVYILAAISPLAFIGFVLPATQGFAKKWFDWFLRFVFMGPIIALVLRVAAVIGNASQTEGSISGWGGIVAFIIVLALLVVAIVVPFAIMGILFTIPGMKQLGGFLRGRATTFYKQNKTLQGISGFFTGLGKQKEQEAAITRLGGEKIGAGILGAKLGGGAIQDIRGGFQEAENIQAMQTKKKIAERLEVQDLIHITGDRGALRNMSQDELEWALNITAKSGIDKAEFDSILNNINRGYNDKFTDRNKFIRTVNSAVVANNKQRVKDNQAPIDVENPFLRDANEQAIQNIRNNNEVLRESTRPSARSRLLQPIIENINRVLNPASGASADQQSTAQSTLSDIENRVNNNESGYSQLRGNRVYENLVSNHGVSRFAQDFANRTTTSLSPDRQGPAQHLIMDAMMSNINTVDARGNPDESAIKRIAQARQAMREAQPGLILDDQSAVKTYFNTNLDRTDISDEQRDRLRNNFIANMDRLGTYYEDYINQILGSQPTAGPAPAGGTPPPGGSTTGGGTSGGTP